MNSSTIKLLHSRKSTSRTCTTFAIAILQHCNIAILQYCNRIGHSMVVVDVSRKSLKVQAMHCTTNGTPCENPAFQCTT